MPKFNKVLLVEDDYITILICERVMKLVDFTSEIISVSNGQEAYDYLDAQKIKNSGLPQIILLDLNMPVMSGWQFLEIFSSWAAQLQTVPAIYILSSTVDSEEKKRALTYPYVKGFISKPLTKKHLETIEE